MMAHRRYGWLFQRHVTTTAVWASVAAATLILTAPLADAAWVPAVESTGSHAVAVVDTTAETAVSFIDEVENEAESEKDKADALLSEGYDEASSAHAKAKEKLKSAMEMVKSKSLPAPFASSMNCATLGPMGAMMGMIGALAALLAKDQIPGSEENKFLGYIAMMAMVTMQGPYFLSTVACNPDKYLAS